MRAAWWSDPIAPSFRSFAPTVLALALLTSLAGFFLLYLSPYVNDAAGAAFTRSPGVVHDHPSTDVGELQQLLGIGSILMTTVLFAVPLHLVRRRWAPPPGTFVLFFGVVTGLFVGLAEFSQPSLVFAGLGAGLAGDVLARRVHHSLSVAAAIGVLWFAYFALYEARGRGRRLDRRAVDRHHGPRHHGGRGARAADDPSAFARFGDASRPGGCGHGRGGPAPTVPTTLPAGVEHSSST